MCTYIDARITSSVLRYELHTRRITKVFILSATFATRDLNVSRLIDVCLEKFDKLRPSKRCTILQENIVL